MPSILRCSAAQRMSGHAAFGSNGAKGVGYVYVESISRVDQSRAHLEAHLRISRQFLL